MDRFAWFISIGGSRRARGSSRNRAQREHQTDRDQPQQIGPLAVTDPDPWYDTILSRHPTRQCPSTTLYSVVSCSSGKSVIGETEMTPGGASRRTDQIETASQVTIDDIWAELHHVDLHRPNGANSQTDWLTVFGGLLDSCRNARLSAAA